ncbi:MAG: hypothetical protein ABJA20_16860 [Novosphingobium sp.]
MSGLQQPSGTGPLGQTPFAGAVPSSANGTLQQAGRAQFGQAATSALSMKWSALHNAAGVIAALAGLAPEGMSQQVRNFPALIRDVGGWRREAAEQGVDDLSVILEAGIAALLAVHARGVDARAAAQALWQEYQSARSALLALTPSADGLVTRRSY